VARSRKGASKGYGWDRFIGGIAIVFDVLVLVIGVAMSGYAIRFGLLDPKLSKLDQPKLIGGLGVFVIVLALVHLVVDVGIFKSRRWAFVVSALLSGYGLWAGTAASSAFMLTYTVLRLGQVFGLALR
jgi:hypothetical protein